MDYNILSIHDLNGRLGEIDLIDIRDEYEYKSGHIPTAKNIPMGELLNNSEAYLEQDKEYYIVCQSGGRSSIACADLSSKGYKVINVSGGTSSYFHPLEK